MKLKIKSSVEKVEELKDVPDLYRQPLAHDDADKWFDEIGLKNTEIKKIFIQNAKGTANIQYAGNSEVPVVRNDEIAIRFFILWLFSKSGGPVKKITTLNEKPELFSTEKDISLSENINEKKLTALRQNNDPQGFFDDFLNFIKENIKKWTYFHNPRVNFQTLDDLKNKLDVCFEKMKEAQAAGEIDIEYINKCKTNYVSELNKIIPYLENYISTIDYTTQNLTHYDSEALNKLEIEKNKELETIKKDQQNELKNLSDEKAKELKPLKDELKEVSDKLKLLKSKENEVAESIPEEEEFKKKQETLTEKIKEVSNKYKLNEKDIQRNYSEKMSPINEKYETLKVNYEIYDPDTTQKKVFTKIIEEKVTVNLSTAILKWKETKGMMSDSYGHIRKIVTVAKWNSFNLASIGKAAFNKKVLKVLLPKGVKPEITNKNIFNYIYYNPSVRYNEENANENIFLKFNPDSIKFNHDNFYEFSQIMDWVRGRELTGQTTVRYYNGRPIKIRDKKNYCNNEECDNYREIVGPLPTDFFVTNQEGQDIVNNRYIVEGVPKMDPCLVCGQPGRLQYPPKSDYITYRQGQIKISEGFPMGLFMFNFPKHRQIIPLRRPVQIINEVGDRVEVDKLICNEYLRPTSNEIEKMVGEYKWSDMYTAQGAYHRYLASPVRKNEKQFRSNTQDYRETKESIISYGNRITGGETPAEKKAGGYGWYWADLNLYSDEQEKYRMGHCGMAGRAASLFSLRVCSADYSRNSEYNYQPWNNYSRCTCSVTKNGHLCQLKAENNSRPNDPKILEKLVDLFCTELKVPPEGKSLVLPFTGLTPIYKQKKLLNGVTVNLADYAKTNMIQPYHGNNQNPGFLESDYQAQNDFHIMDLPDDLLKKFYESRPDFFEFKKCDEADAIMTRLQEIYRIEKEAEKLRKEQEAKAEKLKKEQGAEENQQNSTEQNTGN